MLEGSNRGWYRLSLNKVTNFSLYNWYIPSRRVMNFDLRLDTFSSSYLEIILSLRLSDLSNPR